MNLARFFIDHPVFAAVLSIVAIIAGGLAILALPIAQYPEIAPPTVTVSASYPGANAQTFKVGTNLDVAQVQVQNRVAIAQPQLPQEVQQLGITVKKATPDITLVAAL